MDEELGKFDKELEGIDFDYTVEFGVVGLGDLIVNKMREALENVIEASLAPFLPILNEYETIEIEGE